MRITFLFLFLIIPQFVVSQSYSTVGGIRLGTEFGITFRQLIHDHTTAEGIIQSNIRNDLTSITFLVENHHPLVSRRFNFFMGGGLHKGWYGDNNDETDRQDPWGVTVIAGAEMTLGKLNFSWDYKPALNIRGGEQTLDSQTAISMRYVFEKRKRKKNKRKKRKEDEKEWWQIWKKKEEKKKEKKKWWKIWERED